MRLLFLFLFPMLLLTGCWDRREINDISIVMTTAYDREDNGQYRVTMQIPLVGQLGGSTGGGGGSGGPQNYYIDSETGTTISEAVARLQQRIPRTMFFSHRRVIVVGERLAREGIRELYDVVARVPENRLTAYMIVAKGLGRDLLNAKPKLERFPAEAMRELAKSRTVVSYDLKDIAQMLSMPGADPILVMMEAKKNEGGTEKSEEIKMAGYALFRDDRMVQAIQGDTRYGVNYLNQTFSETRITYKKKGQDGAITFVVDRGKTAFEPSLKNGKIHIDISIDMTANILEDQRIEDSSRVNIIQAREKDLEEKVKLLVEEVLNTMKEQRTDLCSLGRMIYRKNPPLWRSIHGQWEDYLSEMTYSVQVQAAIGNIGLISENIANSSR
jgi:spore germination protein KC